jgi:GTP:adenosylcobinamide-phosphate guanylyltransferase
MEAGLSSIDVTRATSKATTLRHYLQRHRLRPAEVLYFSNEFRPGGNNLPVAARIPGLHVISVNQVEEDTFYRENVFDGGGRGTASAMQQMGDIVERFRNAEAAAEQRGAAIYSSTSILQEKIAALYAEKIEYRQRLLSRSADCPAELRFDEYRRRVRDLDAAVRFAQSDEFVMVLPAAGRGKRLRSETPKPLYAVVGKSAFLYSLEAFGPFVRRIAVVVNPNHRAEFERLCTGRSEQITFVEQHDQLGDARAVELGLDRLRQRRGHVIVAWCDLVLTNADIIRRTINAHLKSEADMTFPTMFERDPYLAILRDEDGRVIDAAFRGEARPSNGYLEHDCSFFVLKADILERGLELLRERAQLSGSSESKFISIIRILANENCDIRALPISVAGSFQGFNTREEAAAIAAFLNRE